MSSEDKKTKDKALDQVAKLMNLAKNGNTTPGEVEAAMTMARKLMDKHGIEEAELDAAAGRKAVVGDVKMAQTEERAEMLHWVQRLAHVVALVTETRPLFCSRREAGMSRARLSVKFFGLRGDAAVAAQLMRDLERLAKECARTAGYQDTAGGRADFRAYCVGFVDGLRSRAKADREEAVSSSEKCRALVVTKGALVEAGYKLLAGPVKMVKQRGGAVGASAHGRGFADGASRNPTGRSIGGQRAIG
jgi:hypothetical protein